jgi:hypothetical protein
MTMMLLVLLVCIKFDTAMSGKIYMCARCMYLVVLVVCASGVPVMENPLSSVIDKSYPWLWMKCVLQSIGLIVTQSSLATL